MDALSVEEGLTRAELEELLETPQRQWHRTLDQLIDTGHVEKSGAGKKGDPHRFKMLRTNAARTTAQNCAESAELSVSPFLPASPLGGGRNRNSIWSFQRKILRRQLFLLLTPPVRRWELMPCRNRATGREVPGGSMSNDDNPTIADVRSSSVFFARKSVGFASSAARPPSRNPGSSPLPRWPRN